MKFSDITTTAAVLVTPKKPLEIINNIKVPLPLTGQVLIKIHYAGLCHSQLMEINGKRGEDKFLPHMLGHEGVGEVIQIGDGVTKVKPGDQVVLGWIKGDGLDGGGCQYETQDGTIINAGAIAAFTQYAIVSENRVVLKPESTPEQLSVLYGCAVPTGLGMALNNIDKSEGKTIAFLGLGGIGISSLLSVKLHQFDKVIAIDVNPDKLTLAKSLGATHTINPKESDISEEVKLLTDGLGVDYCFESAGRVATIEQAFEIVRRGGGKCIFASHPPFGEKIQIDPFELICGKSIEGTWGGSVQPDQDIKKFGGYYQEGLLPLEKLVSKTYKLDAINEAVDDLKNQRVVRALVECVVD